MSLACLYLFIPSPKNFELSELSFQIGNLKSPPLCQCQTTLIASSTSSVVTALPSALSCPSARRLYAAESSLLLSERTSASRREAPPRSRRSCARHVFPPTVPQALPRHY